MNQNPTTRKFFHAGDFIDEVTFSKRGLGGWEVHHNGNHLGWVVKNEDGWAAFRPSNRPGRGGETRTDAKWEATRTDAVEMGLRSELEDSAAGWF